jgi:hypothetical protein
VLEAISTSRPHVQYTTPLCLDPPCTRALDNLKPLSEQSVTHGAMVYCRVDPETCLDITKRTEDATMSEAAQEAAREPAPVGNMRRVIGKDGCIKMVPTNEVVRGKDNGFRPGQLALRDMKMSWTVGGFSTTLSLYSRYNKHTHSFSLSLAQ